MIKSKLTINLCSFIILCAGSIFVHSQLFTDSYIVPKWLFAILAILSLGLYGSAGLLLNKLVKIDIPLAGISITVICLALAIYGILQYFGLFPSHTEYMITGSYDNPAGFAASLCVGLPFAGFLLAKGNKKHIRYAGWAVAVIIIIAVALSYSRAGIVSIAAGTLFCCYKKKPDTEKRIALYVLISIGTFSLFSYPFTYPFVWIASFFSIFIITREYIQRYLLAIPPIKNVLCISVLVFSYRKSLQVAMKCRRYWADYDLELILGENYQRLHQPALAGKYYHSASMMCPSRFLPLYKQFHLYKETGEDKQALTVAEAIINKPIKIETHTIRMIKREMNREILK